jgi:hypothetical protein
MSKWSGCVLILAGVAVGTYALYPQLHRVNEPVSAQVAGGVEGGGDKAAPASAARSASDAAAPKPPRLAAAQAATQAATQAPLPPAEPVKREPPAARVVPPAHLVPPAPVPAQRPRSGTTAVQVDEKTSRVPVGKTETAAAPLDRAGLTREIQRQLKRVGCYKGDVTGAWTPSVRQAMQALTERANASLPINEPDPVLLAMVQSQEPGACSAACPSGQDRVGDGRCVPSALVASAAAKAGPKGGAKAANQVGKRPSGSTVTTASAGASANRPAAAYRTAEERMSLAGPPATAAQQAKAAVQQSQAAPRRAARVAGWSRTATQGRTRRAYRQPNATYSGLPSWFPFLQ